MHDLHYCFANMCGSNVSMLASPTGTARARQPTMVANMTAPAVGLCCGPLQLHPALTTRHTAMTKAGSAAARGPPLVSDTMRGHMLTRSSRWTRGLTGAGRRVLMDDAPCQGGLERCPCRVIRIPSSTTLLACVRIWHSVRRIWQGMLRTLWFWRSRPRCNVR
jgi:hypothetical protein